MMKKTIALLGVLLLLLSLFSGCGQPETPQLGEIPPYLGEPYVTVRGGVPDFTPEEITDRSFELYSPLDDLGRCGTAFACVGRDLMPTEERGSIGMVRPTGWHTVKYDFVDGKYLYNRCHLLGFQLTGENANRENLVTGTRAMNVQGMLPFENMVADYVQETGHHVMYRVTPDFREGEALCRGVLMEALSVEDGGEGVMFCVYAYNAQPGVAIDYATGDSREGGRPVETAPPAEETYVLNIRSKKFHRPDCSGVSDMSEKNKRTYTGSRQELLDQGYSPCKLCNP